MKATKEFIPIELNNIIKITAFENISVAIN